jgi:hypothetical protein
MTGLASQHLNQEISVRPLVSIDSTRLVLEVLRGADTALYVYANTDKPEQAVVWKSNGPLDKLVSAAGSSLESLINVPESLATASVSPSESKRPVNSLTVTYKKADEQSGMLEIPFSDLQRPITEESIIAAINAKHSSEEITGLTFCRFDFATGSMTIEDREKEEGESFECAARFSLGERQAMEPYFDFYRRSADHPLTSEQLLQTLVETHAKAIHHAVGAQKLSEAFEQLFWYFDKDCDSENLISQLLIPEEVRGKALNLLLKAVIIQDSENFVEDLAKITTRDFELTLKGIGGTQGKYAMLHKFQIGDEKGFFMFAVGEPGDCFPPHQHHSPVGTKLAAELTMTAAGELRYIDASLTADNQIDSEGRPILIHKEGDFVRVAKDGSVDLYLPQLGRWIGVYIQTSSAKNIAV